MLKQIKGLHDGNASRHECGPLACENAKGACWRFLTDFALILL